MDASKFEAWKIGHTCELRQAGVDIAALRVASAAQDQEALPLAAEQLVNDWLDSCHAGDISPTQWAALRDINRAVSG